MNEFYVYIWFREDYNTPFYIGKGKTDKNHNRAKTIKNNKHFKRIYNKVPTHVTIVEDNLSEDEAFELEKKIIKFLVNDCGYSQSCPTLCDPMNRSTPGLPVHHQLLEFTKLSFTSVGDAIQPSHPLLSPSPPAFNLSQHHGLFK